MNLDRYVKLCLFLKSKLVQLCQFKENIHWKEFPPFCCKEINIWSLLINLYCVLTKTNYKDDKMLFKQGPNKSVAWMPGTSKFSGQAHADHCSLAHSD